MTRASTTAAYRGPGRSGLVRLLLAAVLAVTVGGAGGAAPAAGATGRSAVAPAGVRVDLRVLLLSRGGPEEAVAAAMDVEGVPYTRVDLRAANRPVVDAAFLAGTWNGRPHARFQAVVVPDDAPVELSAAERTAIADYERTYGIRQVDAFTWAHPGVGLGYATEPGFIGTLDGRTAQVTEEGRGSGFGHLTGPVPIDDVDPAVSETYGYVAVPLPDDAATGTSFRTLVGLPLKGSAVPGSLIGVLRRDGREELVITVAQNAAQFQARAWGHGIITWMTRGVHLGHSRNYLSVHVDDVFLPDARWHTGGNCTPGDDCPDGLSTPDIRMTAADVDALVAWQESRGIVLDIAFNGAGSEEAITQNGTDPLTDRMIAVRDRLRWLNHTWSHPFLGCVQDHTVLPWRCATTATGQPQWVSRATIRDEITRNLTWAQQRGITLDRTELVTGQHSGLFVLPQQPADNPNLALALLETGVTRVAADNSRDPARRAVGLAHTVPRHPMNLFYNVATVEEEVDEYNWIYTRRADGGSGICEDNPATTTCIAPLTTADWVTRLVPLEASIALTHVLANDPRPHYVHQSNLAEDRILYPVLDRILQRYRATFAPTAPIVQPRTAEADALLAAQAAWRTRAGQVTAYVLDGQVHVTAPLGLRVPITVPEGTTSGSTAFGSAYGAERSAWATGTGLRQTLRLPTAG